MVTALQESSSVVVLPETTMPRVWIRGCVPSVTAISCISFKQGMTNCSDCSLQKWMASRKNLIGTAWMIQTSSKKFANSDLECHKMLQLREDRFQIPIH